MHSCSVAVRALLRIEQKADKYRQENDKRLPGLNGQILVFSISHDEHDARLYGHYALIDRENWSYYRYPIRKFCMIVREDDALALHNFVRNLLKEHVPKHVGRLHNALTALPDPTTASPSASQMALNDELRSMVASHQSQLEQGRKDLEQRRKDAEQQREDLRSMVGSLESQLEHQRKDLEQQRRDAEQQRKELMALFQARTT